MMKHKKYRNRAVCALMLMLAFSMAGCGAQSTSVASEMNLESSTAEETEETSMPEQNITAEGVTFTNEDSGLELSGILFRPDGFDEAKTYPAVVVAGPMLSVKEQAQSVYAQRLAEQGYLAMVFDYSYFGESEGEPRQLEVPDVKASDISSVVTFLQSLPYVRESIVESQSPADKGQSGKDMKKQPLHGADMRNILNPGLDIDPVEKRFNWLAHRTHIRRKNITRGNLFVEQLLAGS